MKQVQYSRMFGTISRIIVDSVIKNKSNCDKMFVTLLQQLSYWQIEVESNNSSSKEVVDISEMAVILDCMCDLMV